MRRLSVGVAVAVVWLAWGTLSLAEDRAKLAKYGRHLAQECSSCHRFDGVDNGIPSIVGLPEDTFIAAVNSYRTGARTNPVMVSVAKSLSEQQLKALAVFFAHLPQTTTQDGRAEKEVAK